MKISTARLQLSWAGSGVLPHSCAEVKSGGGTADGNYIIDIGARPVTVYCKNMAGTPADYLPLINTSNGANTSYYAAGQNTGPNGLTTAYTKVRFYPSDLTVDGNDTTFSTSTGWNQFGGSQNYTWPYADAGDCRWDFSAGGTANVDLTGTAFAVASNQFSAQGWNPAGTASYSANNQIVNLTGGGYCGDMKISTARLKLQLL